MPTACPQKKRNWATIFVLSSIVLVGVVMPIGIRTWRSLTPTVALRSGDAGIFISSTATAGGFFSGTLSSVQTTAGSVTVEGVFNAAKGQALKINDLNKDGLQLCAAGDLTTCLRVEGTWSGPLKPATDSHRAFDFERYGLDSASVGTWLVFGVLFSFFSLVTAIAISVKPSADSESDCRANAPSR